VTVKTNMPPHESDSSAYEYVVVGSGAGGGPLAANLARAGHRVLLLEAGGSAENYHYQVPCFHAHASEDPELCWSFFVRHYADQTRQGRDTKFTSDRDGVLYPRAGTLGGCTAHNAMITVVPQDSDWDAIARETGDPSWQSHVMRQYFQRLERCRYRPGRRLLDGILRVVGLGRWANPGRHGFDGWLTTNEADPKLVLRDPELLQVILSAAKEALRESIGNPLARIEGQFDPNDSRLAARSPEGLCFTPLATAGGRRTGTREYIRQVERLLPGKLTVRTDSLATRVLLDDANRAVGVEYLEGPHLYRADPQATGAGPAQLRQVRATREVILSAGAFNTPQLLMLSGIGPRDELARHRIDVRLDRPGVGRNLQDRYEVGVVAEMRRKFVLLENCSFDAPRPGEAPDPAFVEWQSGKGLYTSNGAVVGVVKRSAPERAEPDLYVFGLPGCFRGYYPGYSATLEQHKNYFTWAILKAHTRNTAGRVTLRSSDPRDTPEVVFHYFDEGNDGGGEDLESVVQGVLFVRRMLQRANQVVRRELIPGDSVETREQLREWIKNEAWGHHASCTSRMGARDDPMAVVDSEFRVFGTTGLRIVDASVFPHIPGFFIVTAVYMISEKASDVILAAASTASPDPLVDTTSAFSNARRSLST
jgi:choline dehydrogenase